MEDQHFVQFQLEDGDGEVIFIQVAESEGNGIERASSASGRRFVNSDLVAFLISRFRQRSKDNLKAL